jgi:UDP-N-acetylmuramoylalanine--D-glutamate ligase
LDDPQSWVDDSPASRITFSIQQTADFSLSHDQAYLLRGEKILLETSALALVGTHNYANILASLALAEAVGIDLDASLCAAKQFAGLAHRCQLVARKNGIAWINDSKATNVGATLAALQGLSGNSGRLWLIAGGDSKEGDLSELKAAFAKLAGVVAFGKDKQRFVELANNVYLRDDLESAFAWCAEHAESGDTVLLSPACASLDMYKNFEARGQHFCQLVEAL